MVTIRDVAVLAGVSTATVSHVINNTRYVQPETRQLVLDAIEKLGYRPSGIARSLTTRITHLVGILIADITNPFFAEYVRGVEDRLAEHQYHLIVCNTDEKPEREAHYLDLLYTRRVDGVIVAATGATQPMFNQFLSDRVPLVFIDRRPSRPYGPFIGVDNEAAAYTATKYLIQLGHKRVGFIGRNVQLSTVIGRVAGYRRALAEHDLPIDERLISLSDSSLGGAFEFARRLLTQEPRPTAIVAANHVMALGLLRAIQEMGLRFPGDISVVCFDEHPWAPLFTPSLTVVRMPMAKMCDAAVDLLLQGISSREEHRDIEPTPEPALGDVILQAELVVRKSCSSPASP